MVKVYSYFYLYIVVLGFLIQGMSLGSINAQDVEWIRQFGTADYDAVNDVYIGQTAKYVAGSLRNDAFVQREVHNGTNFNRSWIREFGTDYLDRANAVHEDVSGVYVAGSTEGALPGQSHLGGSDAFIRKYDIDGNELWTRQFGTNTNEEISDITGDATGLYVAGYVEGAIPGQTHEGKRDAFVRKYDTNGNVLWTYQFGSDTDDEVRSIYAANSGIYLTGILQGEAFLHFYDMQGNQLWTRNIGSAGAVTPNAVYADLSGVYLGGSIEGDLPGQTSSGMLDAFISKYSIDGNELWTNQFGTDKDDEVNGISVYLSEIYLAGSTQGMLPGQIHSGNRDAFIRRLDANGLEMWTLQEGSDGDDSYNAITVDALGLHVVGVIMDDAFNVLYDLDANRRGGQHFNNLVGDFGNAISVHATSVYVAGHTSGVFPGERALGSDDAFIRKYDTDGNEGWTRQFGGDGIDKANAVYVDETGVYVAGSTEGMAGQNHLGGEDAFIRKYDAAGNEVWTRQFGSNGYDAVYAVNGDETGLYIVGYLNSTSPRFTSTADAFIRKYDTNGNTLWIREFGTAESDIALDVSVDRSGVYMVGTTEGTFPGQTASGNFDVFIRKYDIDGNEGWTRQFGSEEPDQGTSISVSASGIYVAGTIFGVTDSDSGPVQFNTGAVFVSRFDLDGNEQWNTLFGLGSDEISADQISADAKGVYVVGYSMGGVGGSNLWTTESTSNLGLWSGLNGYIRRYDASGVEVWTRNLGTEGDDFVSGISRAGSSAYIVGSTGSIIPGQTEVGGGRDAFVVKISTEEIAENVDVVWTGGTGDWNVASNWDSNVIPDQNSDIHIPPSENDTVFIPSNVAVKARTIEIGAGSTLYLENASSSITIDDGLMDNDGIIINKGVINISRHSYTLDNKNFYGIGRGYLAFENWGIVENYHELNIIFSVRGHCINDNGSIFINHAEAKLSSEHIWNFGGRFTNFGTIHGSIGNSGYGDYGHDDPAEDSTYIANFLNKGFIKGKGLSTSEFSEYYNFGRIELDSSTTNAFLLDDQAYFDNSGSITIGPTVGENAMEIYHPYGGFRNAPGSRLEIKGASNHGIHITTTGYDTLLFNDRGAEIVLDGIDGVGIYITGEGNLDDRKVLNNGKITFGSGIAQNAIVSEGETQLTNLDSGEIYGTGVIDGAAFRNQGSILPGLSPGIGIFEITDNYDHSQAIYEVELAGTDGPGLPSGHDQLNVTGTTTLGGTLNLSLIDDYLPSIGDSFVIMTCTSGCQGKFETVNLPLDPLSWEITYEENSVTVHYIDQSTEPQHYEVLDIDYCIPREAPFYNFYWTEMKSLERGAEFFSQNETHALTFTEYADGTALIQGTTQSGTCSAELYIVLKDRKNWARWSADGGGFKPHGCDTASLVKEKLRYYVIDGNQSSISVTGGDCLEEGTFYGNTTPRSR